MPHPTKIPPLHPHPNNHHHHRIPPPSTPRSTSTIQACAACRYQRRKCAPDCILAPYFPHDRQRQFQNAHRLFGVSNITKIIKNLDRHNKDEAMRTIIYQSDVRAIDPVGGCYRIITHLQRQIQISRSELQFVLQQLAFYQTLSMHPTTNNNNNVNNDINVNQICLQYDHDQDHDQHVQFNQDLNVVDEIDYDIHLNQNETQFYDDHRLKQDCCFEPVQTDAAAKVQDCFEPLNPSVCDDFKSLLINDVNDINPTGDANGFKFKEANEASERSLFEEEGQKALIKVENVCYNEEEYEIEVKNNGFGVLTDPKAIHVEGEYGS